MFTVVHEQFPTDTVDYADVVLPATTQLEHFDLHGSYGHLYVQANLPAIAPLGEAKSNNDVFRLLARWLGFEPDLFEVTHEELAAEALRPHTPPRRFPAADVFEGITLERLRQEGPIRLNLPPAYAPFAEGGFGTPSGKCELYSPALAAQGLDPLPNYTPPHEDPQTRPELAASYPLQMVSPPHPTFLNSTFVNVASLRQQAGEPTVEIHPEDAAVRGIGHGQMVRVYNGRGRLPRPGRCGRNREAWRGGDAGRVVEQAHHGRRQLQYNDEQSANGLRRRRHLLRQPRGGLRGTVGESLRDSLLPQTSHSVTRSCRRRVPP